jgi:hypothetical protein
VPTSITENEHIIKAVVNYRFSKAKQTPSEVGQSANFPFEIKEGVSTGWTN